jgi:hypothetical protein
LGVHVNDGDYLSGHFGRVLPASLNRRHGGHGEHGARQRDAERPAEPLHGDLHPEACLPDVGR